MFNAKTGEFSSGIEVPAALCPGYCSALENHRLLAIQDALADPRSSELVPICLRDAGIDALLDAPIYLNGEVVGLFCCAHVGGPRAWSEAEQHLTASFSDYSQLVLMADQHHESIETVRAQRARMLRGQPLEIMGAMADMTNYRCSGLYSAIAVDIQHVLNDRGDGLTSEMHAHLLTALSSCEQGARLAAHVQAFSPATAAATAVDAPISALEAAQTVTGMIRSLGVREVRVEVEHAREAGAVRCDRAALTCALFSMAYQCLGQCPLGGQLRLSTQVLTANGRNRDCFEFAVTCSALLPLREFEAGMVLAANFASSAGATLSVEHVNGATRAALRIPLADTGPHQRAHDHGAIVIVADVEEPQELVDMLRFFKHRPVVLSTQDCLGYLRKEQAGVRLVVLDASNSDAPVLDRLRPLRLATNRPIVVIGEPEDCAERGQRRRAAHGPARSEPGVDRRAHRAGAPERRTPRRLSPRGPSAIACGTRPGARPARQPPGSRWPGRRGVILRGRRDAGGWMRWPGANPAKGGQPDAYWRRGSRAGCSTA